MKDYWNDPPEEYEIPECCGFEMKEIENAVMCMVCGAAIYVPVEIDEPDTQEFNYFFEMTGCPHGETGDCNACNIAGDFAYDATRERRYR